MVADRKIRLYKLPKGETHDAVMVVSSPRSGQGGHWKEWLDDPKSEHARFAYVASSRPKNLLVWAVPEPDTEDINRLEELGFQQIGTGDFGNPSK